MTILTVGAGQQYLHIQDAINAAQAGDTINVQAGTYNDEYFTVSKALTIQGVGGMVNITNDQNIPNGKADVVVDANLTIRGFEFSGATVADGNGAGIRYESGNLVVDHCYFHDNQEGILGADTPSGTVTITNSEFAHNGSGDGQTHNLYIGDVASLTIDNSYFHDAVVGHEIKSRAETTTITNSRIIDGSTGTASFSIDLPNGGNAVIKNDVIQQGPASQNPIIIAFGEEGSVHANSALQVTNDTILNDLQSPSVLGVLNTTSAPTTISGDQFYGLTASEIASGPNSQSGNTMLSTEPTLDTSHPWADYGTTSTGGSTGSTGSGGSTSTGSGGSISTGSTGGGSSGSSGSTTPPTADLVGTTGHDLFSLTNGVHSIAGQGGADIAVVRGYSSWYSVSTQNGVTTLVDHHSNLGTVTLTGVSELQTRDGVYDITTATPTLLSSNPPTTWHGNFLQGQTGGGDAFDFAQGGSSHDAISGFDPATDHIVMTKSAGSNLTAATLISTATTDSAGEAIIHLSSYHDVTLHGITPTQLHADWFVIH